jgi:O-antigen ligase
MTDLPFLAGPALLVPLVLLVLWLPWRLRRPAGPLHSPLAWPLLLASLVLVVSSVLGVAQFDAILFALMQWAAVAVMLFLVFDLLALGWQPRIFVLATLITSSMVLLIALGAVSAWLLQWVMLWRPGEQLLPVGFRVDAFGQHPNQVAMLLNVSLPCVVIGLWRERARRRRAFWAAWLLAYVVVLFFTSSRGGWLSASAISTVTLAALLWEAWRHGNRRLVFTALVAAAAYGALFAALLLSQRGEVLAQHGGSFFNPVGRTAFWARALELFARHPLLGAGPAGYDIAFQIADFSSRFFRPRHAHSLYLTTLSELGLAGAAAIGLLAFSAFRVWYRTWRLAWQNADGRPLSTDRRPQTADDLEGAISSGQRSSQEARDLLLIGLGSCVGIFVHGFVDTPSPLVVVLALCMFAAGLATGGAWQVPQLVAPAQRRARLLLPSTLALVAVLAWGCYTLVSREGARWQALRDEAAASLRRGDAARALALSDRAIALLPERGAAYSDRALALARRAQSEPALLPQALEAATLAVARDPANHTMPLNRAMLLAATGDRAAAERELRAFIAEDSSQWALPYLLLAHLREAQGDAAGALPLWRAMVERQPDLQGAAACRASAGCSALPLPPSPYRALRDAELLARRPNADTLYRIAHAANIWESVDLWSLGVLTADRNGDMAEERRFLQAAVDQSQLVGNAPTPLLAIAQLRDARVRGDREAVRELIGRWAGPRGDAFVPAIAQLLVTDTDAQLARETLDAAEWLGEHEALSEAQGYYLVLGGK